MSYVAESGAAPGRRVWLGLTCVAVALLAFVSRKPEQWFNPQFWGEDGRVFFAEAVSLGPAALIEPYAGYFHLVPRVVAFAASAAPWEYLPAIYMIVAALGASAVAARVALADLPLVARVTGAVAMVVVPHSGEVFLNLTNLHWLLGMLLAVNLLEPAPATRARALRRALEIAVAGLSGPMVLCLAPFAALWLVWQRRERRAGWLGAAWALAVGVQFLLVAMGPRVATTDTMTVLSALWWVVPRYVMALLVGEWMRYTQEVAMIFTLLVAPMLTVLFWERKNPYRAQAALLLLAAAGLLVAGRLANPYWGNPVGGAARYVYVPFVLALWAFGWLSAGAAARWRRAIAWVLCGCVVSAGIAHWRGRPQPDLEWSRQVREAREGTRKEFAVQPNLTFPVPTPKTSAQ
ncbi:MAG TPA: hypothetical protein VGE76_08185 [Opitutaceae bacterium]